MKRPRKRYALESEILSEIDALNAKITKECKTAEESDKLADCLFQRIGMVTDPQKLKGKALSEYHCSLSLAKESRRQADQLRRVQARRQKLLFRLKNTLADFRTHPMVFLADASVPLARAL